MLILRALGRDEVHANVRLSVLLELQVVHRGISDIDLTLQLGRLLRSLTDQHRHLTEDVSIHQNE